MAFIPAISQLQVHAAPQVRSGIDALGSAVAAKLLIHVEKPHYPAIAKVNFIQGDVRLGIKVSSKGQVVEAHVADGEPLLAAAALGAVRKWLYRPYVSTEGAKAFTTQVIVKFALHRHAIYARFPTNPEEYLEKQIHPPEIIAPPQRTPSAKVLRLKVLVDSNGKVLDATSNGSRETEIEEARRNLQSWRFRPARWGAIAVPWYVNVNVPLGQAMVDQAANSAKQ